MQDEPNATAQAAIALQSEPQPPRARWKAARRASVRSLSGLVAIALLIGPDLARGDDPPLAIPAPLSLEWCLTRARAENPMLAMSRANADAARERVRPAGALEDPRVSYEASNLPVGDFDFESTPLSGHQLGLRQKLPFPGLLGSRRRAAERGAEAADHDLDDLRLSTEGAVETAWAELAFAQRARTITERNIALLRNLAATAEARYRVGKGLQQDVLRAQVELTALLQERLRRDETIARAGARLAALLDLPPEASLPETAPLTAALEAPPLGDLIDGLEERSPRARAARAKVDAARLQVRAARLEGLPDVDLGLGYRVRKEVMGDPVEGDDFVSFGVTLRLPVDRGRWRAQVAERDAQLRHAEAQLRAIRADLVARTREAHAELVRASSEEALLESGLVPQAQQSLDASRSAYEVGRVPFLDLLNSQVRLLDAELRLARSRADQHRAFAALESAAGVKLR